jgi:hypothetical protein
MASDKRPDGPLVQLRASALRAAVRTTFDHPGPSPEQRARRARSKAAVTALGAPLLDRLPVVEEASSLRPRSAREIADRAVALALAAVKGEGLEQEVVLEVVRRWRAEALFTPEERAFILEPSPSDQDRARFAWRYEGLDVLLWALGWKEALPPPDRFIDVPADVELVKANGAAGLAERARPRTAAELLDQGDLYSCLHGSALELRLEGRPSPRIHEEIVLERHHALNWLIRHMGQEWDEVTSDT